MNIKQIFVTLLFGGLGALASYVAFRLSGLIGQILSLVPLGLFFGWLGGKVVAELGD